MLSYWLFFSVLVAGSLQYQAAGRVGNGQAIFLRLAAILMAAMIGFRFEVGTDWDNYLSIFDSFAYLDWGEALQVGDPGFASINWITHQLGAQIWVVNLICGIVFTWGLMAFAKEQPNPWLALVISFPYLVMVVAMGYTRQGIALGIIMAGLASLQRTSVGRFAIYVFVATLFHKTALVVLPLAALSGRRYRTPTMAGVLLGTATLYYFFLSRDLEMMVGQYVESEFESQGAAIRVAMVIIPAAVFLLFRDRFMLNAGELRLWTNFALAAFGTLGLLLLLPSSTMVDRLALYLLPLQVFVLSRVPSAFPSRQRFNMQIVVFIIVYSAAVQFVWLNYATHAESWLPYRIYPIGDDRKLG